MSVHVDFSEGSSGPDPYPTHALPRVDSPIRWNGQSWLISRLEDITGLMTDDRVSPARMLRETTPFSRVWSRTNARIR